MSTLGTTSVTTADLRASLDPKGNAARVFEVLEVASPFVKNATWMESNMPNGHQSTIQGSEETATKRRYERGVAKTKTVNIPVIDLATMYAANVEVDINKLETFPNPEAYLRGQEHRKVVAIHKDLESNCIYGNNATDPENIRGLATRFNKISTTVGDPGYQVVSAGGSTNLTSLYLIGMGDGGVNLFYPMGSEAGVTRIVKPEERVTDAAGKVYYAYCIFNNMKVGMCVENHRTSILRVANIDSVALDTYGSGSDTSADIIGIALRGKERLEYDSTLKYFWMGNETAIGWLKTMYKNKPNCNITMNELQGGMQEVKLDGIPVVKSFQILNREGQVV